MVKDYVELEKLRFEERLKVKIEVDEKLNSVRILPFSIQLLVENALKHGIDRQMEGGHLDISVKIENSKAVIKIKNPGELNYEGNNGIGLQNLTDRLHLIYDGKAQFSIHEVPHESVLATLIIPIND